MQKLLQAGPSRATEARREIRHGPAGQIARQPVQQRIAMPPRRGGLCLGTPGADYQIVFAEPMHQAAGVLRPVLTVGIDDEDEVARGLSDPGLHRRAVAFGIGMAYHARARRRRALGGRVARAIVDHEHFAPRGRSAEATHYVRDGVFLVQRGNHDRDRRRGRQCQSSFRAGAGRSAAWTSASTTPSQVIVRARSYPASPRRAASCLSAHSRLIASERASTDGSVTRPLTSWTTNSGGPPASAVVITGLRERNASSVTYP